MMMLGRHLLTRVAQRATTPQRSSIRMVSRSADSLARRSKHLQSAPLVHVLTMSRTGRSQSHQLPVHSSSRGTSADALLMAKWATALLASGAGIASARSDDSHAHAAGWFGGEDNSKKNDKSDPWEELQKALRALPDKSLAALKELIPGMDQSVDDWLASGKGGQISWGFMMGACSGFAIKKMSKAGAIAVGSLFLLFQSASYSGYISVNHDKIEHDVMEFLDVNKDGTFDAKDVDHVYKSLLKVLEFNMPAGSGFALGFAAGFRMG